MPKASFVFTENRNDIFKIILIYGILLLYVEVMLQLNHKTNIQCVKKIMN